MDLIDDDFVLSILKSDQYNFPLKKHKQVIRTQLGMLLLKAIAYFIFFGIVYLGINSSTCFKSRSNVPSFLILVLAVSLLMEGLKEVYLLSKMFFNNDFEIKKDFLVETSNIFSRNGSHAVRSYSALFKENGPIEILSSSENYDYYVKRKKYSLKAKKKYKPTISIPCKEASTLFQKLEKSPKKQAVFLVKTRHTKQLITVLFLNELTEINKAPYQASICSI